MEAVAANAGVVKLRREREPLRELGRRPVERGVEARNLREIRRTLGEQSDGREVVRLVEWGERHERLELPEEVSVDARGRGVREPAVHHAVADAEQFVPGEPAPQERQQMIERGSVTEFLPGVFRFDAPGRATGYESWSRVELLDLSATVELKEAPALDVQRVLDAGRAGVENGDRIRHRSATRSRRSHVVGLGRRAAGRRRRFLSPFPPRDLRHVVAVLAMYCLWSISLSRIACLRVRGARTELRNAIDHVRRPDGSGRCRSARTCRTAWSSCLLPCSREREGSCGSWRR